MNNIPRPEYPRPQLVREKWINLNGEWEFEIDNSASGKERKLYEADKLGQKIIVPFCPESKLSGIGSTDFMNSVWYRRTFTLPEETADKRIILHFGAVDYKTEVWVNGKAVGTHKGGYTSFSFEITDQIKQGENVISVCAIDNLRTKNQPSGKQSQKFNSFGCFYTRTTGIWQTVWLEYLPQAYIDKIKLTPDVGNESLHIEALLKGDVKGYTLKAASYYEGKQTGDTTVILDGAQIKMQLKLSELHLWEIGCGRLYDLDIFLNKENEQIDSVKSYFGMRSIALRENKVFINGKPVFQRLVLDQGFYPDGIYTAPSDEALKNDIEISMGLGFNGARLHEKVFEPRFLYWADKLGYIVWGEHANWGMDISRTENLANFLPEWLEAVERDYSHPSIVGWCPFNETQKNQDNEIIRIVYRTTKMLDPTRPVIDTSGWVHVETDIEDTHDYEQNPVIFKEKYDALLRNESVKCTFTQTFHTPKLNFVSEYGGMGYAIDNNLGWGYNKSALSKEELIERYRGLTEALLNNPKLFAFCYTQLYDVEQEINGLYTYNRKQKFDPEIIRSINTQKAAIEW